MFGSDAVFRCGDKDVVTASLAVTTVAPTTGDAEESVGPDGSPGASPYGGGWGGSPTKALPPDPDREGGTIERQDTSQNKSASRGRSSGIRSWECWNDGILYSLLSKFGAGGTCCITCCFIITLVVVKVVFPGFCNGRRYRSRCGVVLGK
eukprot:gene11658-biopygen2682